MKLYVITKISTRADFPAPNSNGEVKEKASEVRIFTNKMKAIYWAKKQLEHEWVNRGINKNETDLIGQDLDSLKCNLEEGKDAFIILDAYNCVGFEFSEHDLSGCFCKDDYVAMKLWNKEDIERRLIENDFAGTEKEVAAVINTGKLDSLEECTDEDWIIIDDVIHQALGNIE